jgi:hypothetical protein
MTFCFFYRAYLDCEREQTMTRALAISLPAAARRPGDRPLRSMTARVCRCWCLLLFGLSLSGRLVAERVPAELGLGNWIWDQTVHDRQECRFVRPFEIPRGVGLTSARLRITADNAYQVFLDGQPIGHGYDWRSLIEYDVLLFLDPGEHVLAVAALNDFDVAGLVVGLRIELGDGNVINIVSDESWKIAPGDLPEWKKPGREARRWRSAIVREAFDPRKLAELYHAPTAQPVPVTLWQRPWFQISLTLLVGGATVAGLFLSAHLVLKTQAERVLRRERARIASDLHDHLGGGLTRLVFVGETSRRGLPPDSDTGKAFGEICTESRGLMQGMNEAVWLINSHRDTLGDFASYVMRYAESFFQDTPIWCQFEVEADLPALPCDLSTRRNLFLAVKEVLNNVLRHSQASTVQIGMSWRRPRLLVSIRDDGRGFDPAAARDGNGLRNIRMRTTEVHGQLTVRSAPGQGCMIEFDVPLLGPAHALTLSGAALRLLRRPFRH